MLTVNSMTHINQETDDNIFTGIVTDVTDVTDTTNVPDSDDTRNDKDADDDITEIANYVIRARNAIYQNLVDNHKMVNYGYDAKLILLPETDNHNSTADTEITTDVAVNLIKEKLRDKITIIDGIRVYIVVPDSDSIKRRIENGYNLPRKRKRRGRKKKLELEKERSIIKKSETRIGNFDVSGLSESEKELVRRVKNGSVQFRSKVTIVLSGLKGYTTEMKFKLFTTFVCHIPGVRKPEDVPLIMNLVTRFINTHSDQLGFSVDSNPETYKCMIKRSESKTGLSNIILQDIHSFIINTGREKSSNVIYEPVNSRGLIIYNSQVFTDDMREKYMSKTNLYRITSKLHSTGAFSIRGVFRKWERIKRWKKLAFDLALFIFSSSEPTESEVNAIIKKVNEIDPEW